MPLIADGLSGLGLPPELAKRLGTRIVTLTAVGTTQGGAPIVANAENVVVNLTTAGGQTAATLPSTAEIGTEVTINVITSTAALIFPAAGHTIANKAQNGNVTVAIGATFIRTTSTLWAVSGGAT